MRGLLVSLVAVAACDVPGAGPPDAPPNLDGQPQLDAPMVDAPDLDAPDVDAPPPPGTILIIENTPFDAGMAPLNSNIELTRTIRNISGASTGVTLTADPPGLQILQHDCATLAAGESCSAKVRLYVDAGNVTRELRATPTAGPIALGPITAHGGHRITVQISGTGRVVTSPAGIDCNNTGGCTALFPPGPLTLTATHAGSFLGWMSGGCSGTAPSCTINVTAPVSIVATFGSQQPTGLNVVTAGLGAGRVTVQGFGACGYGHPVSPCNFNVPSGTPVTLRHDSIGDSVFTGWQGCTPAADGTCTVTVGAVTTVTATFEPITMPAQPVSWVRTSRRTGVRPRQVTVVDNGVIVAGHTAGADAIWSAKYDTQTAQSGNPGANFIDDITSGDDWIIRLADLPGGDIVVLAMLAGDQPTARTSLRRYTQNGQLVWAVEPGGAQERCGLALDANNRIFVSGFDGTTPYITVYSPTGFQLSRYTPAGPSTIEGLAIRGDALAAAGSQGDHGWVGMFDLIGNPLWERTLTGDVPSFDLALSEVDIDSDFDLVFGGLDTDSVPTFVYGTVGPAESLPQWYRRIPTGDQGTVRVLSHDRVRVFVGDPARILDHDEAGNLASTFPIAGTDAIGGLDTDAAGVTYLAGQSFSLEFPAIERRPAPAPSLAFVPSPVDLGLVELGTTPPPVPVTLRNDGSVSTDVVFTPSNPALTVVAHDCTAVAAGATCTVQLRMNLTAPGTVTHQLRATSTSTGSETIVDVTAASAVRVRFEVAGGSGGSAVSSPAGIDCPGSSCEALFRSAPVTLFATPAAGMVLGSWTVTGGTTSSCSAADLCTLSTLTGPVVVRATFVPATLTIRQPNTGSLPLEVRDGAGQQYGGICTEPECRFALPLGGTYTISGVMLAGIAATLHGWGGPCVLLNGGSTCQVTVNAPTTVDVIATAIAPEHWFKYMPPSIPIDLAVTTTGVVVVGQRANAMWMARYATAEGTPGSTAIGGVERPLAIAAHPGGGFYLLVDTSGQRTLRRYADVGAPPMWSIPAPNAGEVATDDAGNVYLANGSIVSYDAAGALRWQVALPNRGVQHIAIRNGLLAAGGIDAGTSPWHGWVAAFNLGGTLQWEYLLQEWIGVSQVQVYADGRVAMQVMHPQRCIQIIEASASSPPPQVGCWFGEDDGATFTLTSQGAAVMLKRHDGSWIDVYGITGTHVRFDWRGTVLGAITSDAAGNVYMFGTHGLYGWPVLIRSAP